jgi:hypothetical protein
MSADRVPKQLLYYEPTEENVIRDVQEEDVLIAKARTGQETQYDDIV